MNLFCLLWMPLFYCFWVSLVPAKTGGPGNVWALLLGSVFALIRFMTGPWVSSGDFGLSRWFSALVDTAGLPALLPLLFFVFFTVFKIIPSSDDPAGFALLWLIPGGIFRSVSRSGRHDPVFLVLVPLLWTAIAVGVPFFFRIILDGNKRFLAFLIVPVILAFFLAAVTCYWAFFCQRFLWGWGLFAAAIIPLLCSLVVSLRRVHDSL
jgi:hypothetical protein